MARDRSRWDERYRTGDWTGVEEPAAVLEVAEPWLPTTGPALDVASGAGRNALHLARRGLRVLAVDHSVEGLRISRDRAATEGLDLLPVLGDAGEFRVRDRAFQVVVNIRFLLRPAFRLLRNALAPGGILVFETYHVDEIDVLGGDIRREFALERGELAAAFSDLEHLVYEEGVFDVAEGERGLARLVARKPGER